MSCLNYVDAREMRTKVLNVLLLIVLAVLAFVIAGALSSGVSKYMVGKPAVIGQTVNTFFMFILLVAILGGFYALYRFVLKKQVRRFAMDRHFKGKFLAIFQFSPENANLNRGTTDMAYQYVGAELYRMADATRTQFELLRQEEATQPTSLTDAGIQAQREKIENQRSEAKGQQAEAWLAYDVAAFLGFIRAECLEEGRRTLERMLELTEPFAQAKVDAID